MDPDILTAKNIPKHPLMTILPNHHKHDFAAFLTHIYCMKGHSLALYLHTGNIYMNHLL